MNFAMYMALLIRIRRNAWRRFDRKVCKDTENYGNLFYGY